MVPLRWAAALRVLNVPIEARHLSADLAHAVVPSSTAAVYGRARPSRQPTEDDHREAVRLALAGLSDGATVDELARRIESLHPRNNTFPGEVFLELAADAIEASGASRREPINVAELLASEVPNYRRMSRTHRFKLDYALRAAAMIRAGVQPDVLEDAGFWRQDDIWLWSLEALAVYVRAASERRGITVADLCTELAALHGVTLLA